MSLAASRKFKRGIVEAVVAGATCEAPVSCGCCIVARTQIMKLGSLFKLDVPVFVCVERLSAMIRHRCLPAIKSAVICSGNV